MTFNLQPDKLTYKIKDADSIDSINIPKNDKKFNV